MADAGAHRLCMANIGDNNTILIRNNAQNEIKYIGTKTYNLPKIAYDKSVVLNFFVIYSVPAAGDCIFGADGNFIRLWLLVLCKTMTLLQVINAYMNLLQRRHNDVFVFPSYQAVLWDNDRYTWLWPKVICTCIFFCILLQA